MSPTELTNHLPNKTPNLGTNLGFFDKIETEFGQSCRLLVKQAMKENGRVASLLNKKIFTTQ
jgi:hypothetical protein